MPQHLRSWLARIAALGLLLGIGTNLARGADENIRYIDPSDSDGTSAAVIVPDVPLPHTVQVLPLDNKGKVVGKGNAGVQTLWVLDEIERLLPVRDKAEPVQFVKLNVVIANEKDAEQVRTALSAMMFDKSSKPAVTYVVGKLRHPDALVAMDAIALYAGPKFLDLVPALMKAPVRIGLESQAHLSVLPAGPKLYVSGQAEKGKNLAEMTRNTMESLGTTLKHLGLDWKDVYQIKSFLGPMTGVDDAEREIASFFKDGALVPPLVFVEWTTEPSIEIELIASSKQGPQRAGDTVEFITPPGMTASPVFSRVARVAAGKTIYISGLYGDSQEKPEAEIREIFGRLGTLLEKTGSDFRHLAKATYYVSTNEASTKLGTIRPEFHDPQRPPAASKAPVTGTGRPGRTITLDMIAVPAPK